MVPGERWPGCPGRQRQIGDHGLGPALRRRPFLPVPGQPAEGQRARRPRRRAVVRLAAQSVGELPVKYLVTDTGFGTGLDVGPTRHRLPRLGRLRWSPVRSPNRRASATPGPPAPDHCRPPRHRPPHRHLYPATSRAAAMRRRTVRNAVRVALFTAMCLVFVFVLVTVFGQFLSTRAPTTAPTSPTCPGSRAATSSASPGGSAGDRPQPAPRRHRHRRFRRRQKCRSPVAPKPPFVTKTSSATGIWRSRTDPDRSTG